MAEIGGQKRQFALGILIGPIPVHECVGRESVSQVVQQRAVAVGSAAETNLPGQCVERSMNLCPIKPMAGPRDEQVGRYRSLSPMAFPSADVFCEYFAGRGMQRHQTILAELGTADGQHPCFEVDILKLEINCFAKAQARDTQQPQKTVVDPGTQLVALTSIWDVERGAQQITNLGIGVQIWSRPLRTEG